MYMNSFELDASSWGGRIMQFEDNFVPVPVGTWATIMDPVLKLRLKTGRWNPESAARGGTIEIKLNHDPEILPGRLTMPPSENRQKRRLALGNPALTEVAFESDKSVEICTMGVDIHDRNQEIALTMGEGDRAVWQDDPTFRYNARLIEMADRDVVSAQPWPTLLYMLKSIPLIPFFEHEYAAGWSSKRVSLYVSRPLARELAQFAGFQMSEGDDELVRISSREIVA